MRKIFSFLLLLMANFMLGQVFYKSVDDDDFKELLQNGITYIPSGNNEIDNAYILAFKENWKVSTFEIFEGTNKALPKNKIVAIEAYLDSFLRERVLAFIKYDDVIKMEKKKDISKYRSIGYINLNGFSGYRLVRNQSFDMAFFGLLIKGMNDAVQIIKDNNINKIGLGLYKSLYEITLPKSKVLQTKTLLIINDILGYIDLNALEKKGIKYKVITIGEYLGMKKEELSDYCLMYFSYHSFTEISIYDLSNYDLVYTRHFVGSKSKFNESDIKEMIKKWEQ